MQANAMAVWNIGRPYFSPTSNGPRAAHKNESRATTNERNCINVGPAAATAAAAAGGAFRYSQRNRYLRERELQGLRN
jgi:hypothetical protein